ncbi:MAG: TIGR04255 family protein [Promethearchaeota archaeon]
MKKIKKIRNPPLERVVLQLDFSEDFSLNLSKAGEIPNKVAEFYNREPYLVLLPIIAPGQAIEIPPMGPLRFSDQENKNWLEIGKKHIIFTFKKYIDWPWLLERILNIIFILKEILEFKSIDNTFLTYINKFNFQKDGFDFDKFFTVFLKKPGNWEILPHDIFIGILPIDEDNEKIILRLKSLKDIKKTDEILQFTSEIVYLNRGVLIPVKKDKLKIYLTHAHDQIINYFIEFLTQEHHKILGLEIEDG